MQGVCGGSIPVVADFSSMMQIPVVMMGYGLDSDGLHAPNPYGQTPLAGDDPFIMQADGKGWLYAPKGVLDGPLPTHYEPQESPVANALYAQQRNPSRVLFARQDNLTAPSAGEPGADVYPYVFTTYRLTEHHTAGGMSRYLEHLAELQPEMFIEVSQDALSAGSYTVEVVNEGSATHDLVVERDGSDVASTDTSRQRESRASTSGTAVVNTCSQLSITSRLMPNSSSQRMAARPVTDADHDRCFVGGAGLGQKSVARTTSGRACGCCASPASSITQAMRPRRKPAASAIAPPR